MIQLTDNGVIVQTYEEIFNELANGYKSIYGNDIKIDPDTPDGQRIGIAARRELDMQVFLQNLYNQLDPDLATGLSLEKLIKFSGITRRPATKSQADVIINVDRSLTLPDNYKVQDELGQIWQTVGEKNLSIGDNTVTVFAEDFGAVVALENTINEQATIILGVTSVNNPAAATVGTDEETDQELRIRRQRSTQNPSTSTVGGLFSVLGNLTNVTDLAIYENDTDEFDNELLLEPHSIWIVIEGGSVVDIVEAVIKNKTMGTGLKGDVTGDYTETVTVGGLTYTNTTTVQFDRPVVQNVSVRVNIRGDDGSTPNQQLIKQALADTNFVVGDELVASRLYGIIYRAQSNIIATDLEVSTNGVDFVDDVIEASPAVKYNIDINDIEITIA